MAKAKNVIVANAVKFAVRQGFRPAGGAALFTYTHAWLTASGLAQGGTIGASVARKIAGDTAIGYHVNKTGCLEIVEGGQIRLTEAGHAKFGTRPGFGKGISAADVEAWHAFFKAGELTPAIGVKVKEAIIQVG